VPVAVEAEVVEVAVVLVALVLELEVPTTDEEVVETLELVEVPELVATLEELVFVDVAVTVTGGKLPLGAP